MSCTSGPPGTCQSQVFLLSFELTNNGDFVAYQAENGFFAFFTPYFSNELSRYSPDKIVVSTSRKPTYQPRSTLLAASMADKQHLYLVDGSSYIFRAYHRLPPLTDPEGTPVGAV